MVIAMKTRNEAIKKERYIPSLEHSYDVNRSTSPCWYIAL
jgi:hypothetical protein